MASLDPWLPRNFPLPSSEGTGRLLWAGDDWQIYETAVGRALVASADLVTRWENESLVDSGAFKPLRFGALALCCFASPKRSLLAPVSHWTSTDDFDGALAFAKAMKATRDAGCSAPLAGSIYIEKLGLILPSYENHGEDEALDDATVLGAWLTGGSRISVTDSYGAFREAMTWLDDDDLREILAVAGLEAAVEASGVSQPEGAVAGRTVHQSKRKRSEGGKPLACTDAEGRFELVGRPALTTFFNDHVIDIVENLERYERLGIHFPAPVVLYGPPGTGKTYAVQQLADYLGWPVYEIDASSVASPYIHETSKKVAEVFVAAKQHAPSVLVIDEMESFIADRGLDTGGGLHHVEEVAEFLRRIPEASDRHVLVIGMTNKIEMIDPAALRRGRFDHILKVDVASKEEIQALLEKLLKNLPTEADLDLGQIASRLQGRPLSDVAFTVREAGRLAVRSGRDRIGQEELMRGIEPCSKEHLQASGVDKSIGFV